MFGPESPAPLLPKSGHSPKPVLTPTVLTTYFCKTSILILFSRFLLRFVCGYFRKFWTHFLPFYPTFPWFHYHNNTRSLSRIASLITFSHCLYLLSTEVSVDLKTLTLALMKRAIALYACFLSLSWSSNLLTWPCKQL
jgi:hypothetical protein